VQLGRLVERLLLGLALVSVLGGALLLPIASVAWPRYQVWAALPVAGLSATQSLVTARPAGRDPWGRPWARHPRNQTNYFTPRSTGPNGVDEGGGGDDIAVDSAMEAVRLAPQLGALLAVGFLWLAAAVRALRGGRGPEAWHDAARAAVAASAPAAVVALLVAAWGVPAPARALELLVPPGAAVIGAAWLVLTLAALGWRVRRGVPRRRRARVGRGLVAGLLALAAGGAAVHATRLHGTERWERYTFLGACVGRRGPALPRRGRRTGRRRGPPAGPRRGLTPR